MGQMDEPEILLALEPLTMALIGSTIFSAVSGWFGAKSQASQQRDQFDAARQDAEEARVWEAEQRRLDREFQAQQGALGRAHSMEMFNARAARVDAAAEADLARRAPITASVARLGPSINNLLGAG